MCIRDRQYFDPRFGLYKVYEPKPWEILLGFPQFRSDGNMEVVMGKKEESDES